jgi:hypothetical protein
MVARPATISAFVDLTALLLLRFRISLPKHLYYPQKYQAEPEVH